MSMNFDTLFGPYQDKTMTLYSYDWVDVDSATGYVGYDGFNVELNTGYDYLLERSSERYNLWARWDSNQCAIGDYTSLTNVLDIDYDTNTFKKARTIRGTAYVRIRGYMANLSGTSNVYFIVKLRKWNGATETEIASVQSGTITLTDTNLSRDFVVPIEVPETVIAVNEQIRLTIGMWIDVDTDTSTYAGFKADPQVNDNRLVFTCPFKIDAIPT